MLGSTRGTLTTSPRDARVIACGDPSGPAVRGHEGGGPPDDPDVSGRPSRRAVPDLDRLFRPGSVAVIAAPDAPGPPDPGAVRRLVDWAERVGAQVHPVHPTRREMFGLPCHASVADLPERPDLAVLLADGPVALGALVEELGPAGTRFAVAPAGRGPGPEGAAAVDRLAAAARRAGVRLLGPDSGFGAFERLREDLDGPAIALITQAGLPGRPVLGLQELGIRISHWAPTGGEADLDCADFLSYFADRPEVGAIALYLAEPRDGRDFLLAADHAARARVPVVAVKVGRTGAGGRATPSGAAGLPGPDAVLDAAMRQFGVVRVDGPDELQDTAALLARARPPRAEGVAVYAVSEGAGAHFADLATAAGLPLTALPADARVASGRWAPDGADAAGPVGGGGMRPAADGRVRDVLDAILADPAVGVLVCPIPGPVPPVTDRLVRALVAAAEETDKPVCVVWGSAPGTEDAYRTTLLGSSRVCTFRTFGNCVTAVRAYLDHHRFAAAHRSPFPDAPRALSPSARKARPLLRPGHRLSEHAAKQLLRAYGIRVPREQLVTSAAGAVRAAGLVGYPVVMRLSASRPVGRPGPVRAGITSAGQVRDGYRELTGTARSEGVETDGVLVCQTLGGGVRTVVGIGRDALFGPVVTVRLGGDLAGVMDEVAVRVPPFGEREARRMLGELRGRALLDGVGGAPPADLDALVEVVLRVQRIAMELGDGLEELAVDPLLVLGQGAVALGAHVVCR
ncbi:acetate--CoA ligase family protein [Streptomyces sp. NPDC018031]|uniref:acetate--CoA ligase family protein n=1 Tax=Streptomyces sp. NPDC018031 TaxID=3365033 RepID=UPI0037A0A1D7